MPFDIASSQILAQPATSYMQGRALRLSEDHQAAAEQRAQQDQAVQMEQAKVQLGAVKAKKIYASMQQVLAVPEEQRKQFVEENFPDLVKQMSGNGHDWDSFDNTAITKMAQGIGAHAAAELGMTPDQGENFTLKPGEVRYQNGKQVASVPAVDKSTEITPYQSAQLDIEKQKLGLEKDKAKATQLSTDNQEVMAQSIAKYQQQPFGAYALGKPQNQAIMARVMEINPNYSSNEFSSRKKAYADFSTGKNGNQVRSFNVALSHLDTLGDLTDALGNGNLKLVNQIGQTVKEQTGNPAPTNFDAAKKLVGDEIVKAIVGSGGGVADREEVARSMSKANSPAALKGVIKTYQALMGGQLGGLKQQFEKTTGRQDFESFLSPEAQQYLHHNSGSKGPSVGAVQDGYRFKGGNPADPHSWEPVK